MKWKIKIRRIELTGFLQSVALNDKLFFSSDNHKNVMFQGKFVNITVPVKRNLSPSIEEESAERTGVILFNKFPCLVF